MLEYRNRNTTTNVDSTSICNVISSGNVYITDVTSGGIVSSKTYLPNTIPQNYILNSVITDNASVTIQFIAEPTDLQSPIVTVDSITCTNLQQFADDRRLFHGSVTINVTSSRDITVLSNTGKYSKVTINRAALAPVITNIQFINGYPSGQTEVKQNDVLTVKVTFDSAGSAPTQIDVLDYGISKSKSILTSATELNQGTVHTATFTIATRYVGNTAQLLPIQLKAKNSFGTYSNSIISNIYGTTENIQVMKGCDLIPTITVNATTYPSGQGAFKDNEVGNINVTVSNYSSIVYSSPNNDFTISNPTTYTSSKQITCNNTNTYNDSVNNISVVATRSANGTSTTSNFIVEVADVNPIINVYHSETSLRSTSSGYSYTIYAVSNQKLLNIPSVNIPISGTWEGSAFTGSLKNYQRNILIRDSDIKGLGVWTLGNVTTNKAGLSATITGTQKVQGFRSRTIVIPSFGASCLLSTAITDINNVIFSWSFKQSMAFQPIGSISPIVGGQTIDGLNLSTTVISLLDTQACAASSYDSYITIEEL